MIKRAARATSATTTTTRSEFLTNPRQYLTKPCQLTFSAKIGGDEAAVATAGEEEAATRSAWPTRHSSPSIAAQKIERKELMVSHHRNEVGRGDHEDVVAPA